MKLSQRIFLISLFGAAFVGLFESQGVAAGGNVLWEEEFGIGWYNTPSGVLVNGDQLVITGTTVRNDESSNGFYGRDGLIGAYDVNTGGLLWSGGMGMHNYVVDYAVGVATSNQRYFVAGVYQQYETYSWPDWSFHRKYDPLDGNLEWEKPVATPRSDRLRNANSIAAVQGKFFISGTVWPSDLATAGILRSGPPQAFTRGYKSDTGALVWEVQDPPSSAASLSVTSGNQLFVIITKGDSPVVRAYDVNKWAKLWQKTIGNGKSVAAIKVSGNQLVVAGSSLIKTGDPNNYQTSYDLFVQSYRADTGAALWKDTPSVQGDGWATGAAIGGGKVFISGAQTNAAGNLDFLVRAYDAVTGRLSWQSVVDKGGRDLAQAIAFNSSTGTVVAVGSGERAVEVWFEGDPEPIHRVFDRFLVRAYNVNSGALAWEDFSDNQGYATESLSHVVTAGDRLVGVGVRDRSIWDDCGGGWDCQNILIRAYEAK